MSAMGCFGEASGDRVGIGAKTRRRTDDGGWERGGPVMSVSKRRRNVARWMMRVACGLCEIWRFLRSLPVEVYVVVKVPVL